MLSPGLLAAGVAVGLLAGAAASWLVNAVLRNFGFLMIFAAVAVGSGLGEVMSRVIRRKTSVWVGAATALGCVLGVLIGPLAKRLSDAAPAGSHHGPIADPWSLAMAAVIGAVAWYRVR